MKRIFLFACVCILFFNSACFLDREDSLQQSFTVATWNVQNVFNAIDEGTEYSEYLISSGWNDSFYKSRLKNMNTVFSYEGLSEADVIILNEVENDSVIEDILKLNSLKRRGFQYYASCGETGGAIKVAVISRIPIDYACVHSVKGARPILETRFSVSESNIVLFALHAKSNVGDEVENIMIRSSMGKLLEKRCNDILEQNPLSIILCGGDYNEEFNTGNIVLNPSEWYCFWEDRTQSPDYPGSYYYRGQWLCYDNIIVRNNCGKTHNCNVIGQGLLINGSGIPNAFSRSLLSGVSDHLPVWISLSM